MGDPPLREEKGNIRRGATEKVSILKVLERKGKVKVEADGDLKVDTL
jgi:hypothetical protein